MHQQEHSNQVPLLRSYSYFLNVKILIKKKFDFHSQYLLLIIKLERARID